MAATTFTPINPAPRKGWQLSSTTPADAMAAMKNAATLGYSCRIDVDAEGSPAVPEFDYVITSTGPTEVPEGGWVVSDGISVQIYTNLQMTQLFTANVPLVWGPTTTSPVATAIAGASANLVFPQPTSPNGPWTYTVSQTDTTTSTTGAATVGSAVVDANGNVTLPVSGLVVGHVYTFVVTVNCTNYAGVTATALVTAAITAVT